MTARTVTLPTQALCEDIVNLSHTTGRGVAIVVGVGSMEDQAFVTNDPDNPIEIKPVFKMISSAGVKDYRIEGADYTELMSASPSWSPNKPAGVFRIDDLWYYVDKYRAAS